MNTKKSTLFIITFSLLLASCGTGNESSEADGATDVPQTQTANTQESPTPAVEPTGDYQPLSEEECFNLNTTLSQQIGLPGTLTSPEPFEDSNHDKTGFGCKISLIADAADLNHNRLGELVPSTLEADGWVEDRAYILRGTGSLENAYRKGDQFCLTVNYVEPWEDTLCPENEDFVTCLDRLPPEQIREGFELNCARPVP
ncbi:MAG: hypothetical protein PVJ21_15010 [Anaerolineales bacterium]|jgi:hypothetical protein